MKDILDLTRFPLDQPDSIAWRTLVSQCRAKIETDGMFNLIDFMHPEIAAQTARTLAPDFTKNAFSHIRKHNIYFRKSIPELPDGHPALHKLQTSNQTLCADQLTHTALHRLYHWEPFIRFLAATMDKPKLHITPDPLAAINAMSYSEDQTLNWHFDRSEFTTTLLLQAPDQGGVFEYRPNLRSDTEPNYDGVAKLLSGADSQCRQMTLTPGTLNVFAGKNTAHRVTPVVGKTPRVIGVFSYFETPDIAFSDEERIGFYGRAK